MALPAETKVIHVVVDAAGARAGSEYVNRSLRNIDRATERTQRSVQLLNRALYALAAFDLVRRFVELADSFTLLDSRIAQVSQSSEEHALIFGRLMKIARETYISYEGLASAFARVHIAAGKMGFSASETAGAIEVLAKSARLAGVRSQEAANFMIQFSQGIASGKLAGDELRSVLENNVLVARMLENALKPVGITIGNIRDVAAKGMLPVQAVMYALLANLQDIRREAGELPPTIEGSFEVLRNKLGSVILALKDMVPFVQFVSEAILGLADNVSTLVNALVVLAGSVIPILLLSLRTLAISLSGLSGGLLLPLMVIGAILAEMVYSYSGLSAAVDKASESLRALGDVEKDFAGMAQKSVLDARAEQIEKSTTKAMNAVDSLFGSVATKAEALQERIKKAVDLLAELRGLQAQNASQVDPLNARRDAALATMSRINRQYAGHWMDIPDETLEEYSRARTQLLDTADALADVHDRQLKLAEASDKATEAARRLREQLEKLGVEELLTNVDRTLASSYSERDKLLVQIEHVSDLMRLVRSLTAEQIDAEAQQTKLRLLGEMLDSLADKYNQFNSAQALQTIENAAPVAYLRLRAQQEEILRAAKVIENDPSLTDADRLLALREAREAWIALEKQIQGTGEVTKKVYRDISGGLEKYTDSLEEKSVRVADAVANVFNRLETSIADMITRTELRWRNLVDVIVSELARLAVQQYITLPLASGLGQVLAPATTGAAASRPARSSDGVVVNVHDNRSAGEAPVRVNSRVAPSGQREIDIIVEGSVRRALSGGALDRQMRSYFGQKRVGA